MSKPDWNRIAFAVTVVVVAVLVALGKLPMTSFTALLAAGGFGAWLLPTPLKSNQNDGHNDHVDGSPE